MPFAGILFEWDPGKATSNLKKHGVSFEDALTVFGDPLSITIQDNDHSRLGEERLVTLGRSEGGKTLIVVHLDKDESIRIISARSATRRERRQYEEDNQS